ncbi:MAG: DUF2235 domain-containing protein [Flavobacteriales bacterium]
MARNLVICCDGTNNSYGDENTNVVKLFAMLERSGHQLVYYDPGVGTFGVPGTWSRWKRRWTELLGLAFGLGFEDNLFEAYRYLMDNYEAGDRIHLFGFSRGAFTVRALAALVHFCGLLHKGSENLVPYAFRVLERKDFAHAQGFKELYSRDVRIHFIGVWDTVKSLRNASPFKDDSYPYTSDNPSVDMVRHAISLDERRCFYRQNAWTGRAPGQDVKEVWFPGVHCDVGGGYAERDSGLSKIALAWMVREAADRPNGLLVDAAKRNGLLTASVMGHIAAPDPKAMLHRSLHGIWWILEFIPKRRRQLVHMVDGTMKWESTWRIYHGRRRTVPPMPVVHQSVLDRMAADPHYRPPNMPAAGQFTVEP